MSWPSRVAREVWWWMRRVFYHPLFNWYVNHFNWVHMEGQVFKFTNLVCVKWNGNYNKRTSTLIKSENPSLYKKFKNVAHGSVIQCDYIWGVDGRLKNVRNIKCVATWNDLVGSVRHGSTFPDMVGSPNTYLSQLAVFSLTLE